MVLIISRLRTKTFYDLGNRDLPSCLSGGDLDGMSKIWWSESLYSDPYYSCRGPLRYFKVSAFTHP